MVVDSKYKLAKRDAYTKHRYGFSLEEYTEKLKKQDFKCSICYKELLPEGYLTHLDHNHTTGKIRAFLCSNCNRGLGHFKESPDNLKNAIKYLETYNT